MFASLKLYLKQNIELKDLVQTLVEYNYQSSAQVDQEGDFSRRGGIIDIFPVTFENPLRIELLGSQIHSLRSFDLISGRTLENHQLAIILPRKIFQAGRVKEIYTGFADQLPLANFVDLEIGDLVVHVNYGIGRYLGIKELKVETGLVKHLVVEYAEGDKLYVPVQDLHLLNKYIAFMGRPARLSKLGTKTWQKIKTKTKQGIFSLASELIRIQAARASLEGFSFSQDHDWQKKLEQSFPYQETPDQAKSTLEVKRDMQSSRPMDRLLCGDVGYGKTEVALRAAFKAVMDNKQVALLVPTTILAEQHLYTFMQRLKDFPVNVQMLSRFRSLKEQTQIIAGLNSGVVDIVIGTHRLLSDDIQFKDLGLVIIDEEQRFGLEHKEKLKRFRLLVDVLTLTATPIPRTLYMSLMGARDMSIINTPPLGRMPIETRVLEYDEDLVKTSIERELQRDGQCYFVYNRVKGIERMQEKITQLLPRARVASAHGQMPEKELEQVMLSFIKGEVDVLVTTTIVESGIDIPRANTLLVERADRFGLAELYQLRGRVGRFKYKAYAYFLVPRGYVFNEDAKKRLGAIEKFTELGSGFKIAMEDLQIRGAGNLLGPQQHGFITAVGFDLYCRLLRLTIEELAKK
ncbi:MAG: transcription-repair coupling factor [Candidatus Omnitrophica bacterium]|nr:transcription-repair coupling factor [Candidatus Omnitrophota bacterium]